MWLKTVRLVFVLACLAAVLVYVTKIWSWRTAEDRVYRIGWQDVPPFQQKGPDGAPMGLAIDLVRDAARRRGIRLQWIRYTGSSETALRNNELDLWPLITVLPERRAVLYISTPYLQHDNSLLVLADSPYHRADDLASASIGILDLPINRRLLTTAFPQIRLVPRPTQRQIVDDVCARRSDAAFMDEFTAGSILLGGLACPNRPMRVVPLPMLGTQLGIGSTFASRAAADEIRRGIDDVAREGGLETVLAKWGFLSARNLEYFSGLLNAQRRSQWLAAVSVLFAGLFAVASFAMVRIRRQRNLIRAGEEALRESEHRFRELMERVQLVAIMVDQNGVIRFCNDYTLALTGWNREDLVGRPAREFLDRASLARAFDQPGRRLFVESAILAKDGIYRWVQWNRTRLRDSTGGWAGFAVIGADVTELRRLRAESAQIESEERFRVMANTAPLMIWVTGLDMRCTFVNQEWLSFTGRALEQELGEGWTFGVHPEDREACVSIYGAAFEARRAFQVETRLRRADGEYRWVLGSAAPRFETGGEFAGYIGTCTDITELKRSQIENVARQRLETVATLAGGIAHDFNNLLGAVLAQADLALSELAAGSAPQEELNRIRTVAIRGAAIVRQLMIYSGQETATSEAVDISSLIADMMELLEVVVSKHAVLKTELCPGASTVQANPSQLRQLVMNLVTNASEAIGEQDGVVTIRTSTVPADGGVQFIQLEVTDTGCGMTPEAQAKIFDPFFTTKSGGRGLGLAVVQGIVRSLGGSIEVQSTIGAGTTFRILLRVAAAPAQPMFPANGTTVLEEARHAAVVLVVEDEATLRHAVSEILRRKGFSVLEAGDGTAAVQLIREQKDRINLVLLDITLPGAPSRDVYIEARRARPEVKVVVTSAYGQSKVDSSFPGLPIDSFIRKPYQLGDLVSLVRRLTTV